MSLVFSVTARPEPGLIGWGRPAGGDGYINLLRPGKEREDLQKTVRLYVTKEGMDNCEYM